MIYNGFRFFSINCLVENTLYSYVVQQGKIFFKNQLNHYNYVFGIESKMFGHFGPKFS